MFESTYRRNALRRFEVTITQDGGPGVINSFTWAPTYLEAYVRVVETMDTDGFWDGWSFKINKNGR